MNTAGYDDVTWAGVGRGHISHLVCVHCRFTVWLIEHRRGTDRSGYPAYNRARAVMVKHLHAQHRDALAAIERS